MTIFLPSDIPKLHQALDRACERVVQCRDDKTFYALLIRLIANIREHALLKDYLSKLHTENLKKKEDFCVATLDALETSWIRLWKYHQRLECRKHLVAIKQSITHVKEISYSPLYERIMFRFSEFCYRSPFCHSISTISAIFQAFQHYPHKGMRVAFSKSGYFKNKTLKQKRLNKNCAVWCTYRESCKSALAYRSSLSNKHIEHIAFAFFFPKAVCITETFLIPGHNTHEKRVNMHTLAETHPAYCWERLDFLDRCYKKQKALSISVSLKGKWSTIREAAWELAFERCEQEVLKGAHDAFVGKLSQFSSHSPIDSMLLVQHRVYRADFERYLNAFKHHMHARLSQIENMQAQKVEDPRSMLPGSKKEDFVVQLARQYWKKNPKAKRDDVFEDYCMKCPIERQLSRTSWDRIIRKHKVDPRSKDEIKRGPGKKTLQN